MDKRLLLTRLICGGLATGSLIYCLLVAMVAQTHGGHVLGWPGLLGRPLPVPQVPLMVAAGLLTPLLVVLLRVVTGSARPAYGEGREAVSDQAFEAWMRRQCVFFGLSETPVFAAMVLALCFGAQPLLWLVAGETLVVLLFYMPRARDLDPEAF